MDLLSRKVLLNTKGKCVRDFSGTMLRLIKPYSLQRTPMGQMMRTLARRTAQWNVLTTLIVLRASKDREQVGSSSVDYLHRQVASWFKKNLENDFIEQLHSHCMHHADTNNHGRVESREHWLMAVPEHLKRATKYWAKLQTIAMVRRTRQVGDKSSEEIHYYISSLPLSTGVQTVVHAIRSHWAVENALHWSL